MQCGELEASDSSNSLALGSVFVFPVSEWAGAALWAVCASLFITRNRSSGKRPSPRLPGWPALVWSICCAAFLFFFFFQAESNPLQRQEDKINQCLHGGPSGWRAPLIPIMSRDVKATQKLHPSWLCEEEESRKNGETDAENGTPWALTWPFGKHTN